MGILWYDNAFEGLFLSLSNEAVVLYNLDNLTIEISSFPTGNKVL